MLRFFALGAAASLLTATAAIAQPPQAPSGPPAMMNAPTPPQGRTERPRGRFAQMDANRDGRVTLQEFLAFQDKMFDRIDAGHRGQITKADVDAFAAERQAEEAGRLTRGQGGRGGGAAGGQLAKLSDRLASGGVISRQQWEAMMSRRFQRLDANRAGFLTADAFQAIKGPRAQTQQ